MELSFAWAFDSAASSSAENMTDPGVSEYYKQLYSYYYGTCAAGSKMNRTKKIHNQRVAAACPYQVPGNTQFMQSYHQNPYTQVVNPVRGLNQNVSNVVPNLNSHYNQQHQQLMQRMSNYVQGTYQNTCNPYAAQIHGIYNKGVPKACNMNGNQAYSQSSAYMQAYQHGHYETMFNHPINAPKQIFDSLVLNSRQFNSKPVYNQNAYSMAQPFETSEAIFNKENVPFASPCVDQFNENLYINQPSGGNAQIMQNYCHNPYAFSMSTPVNGVSSSYINQQSLIMTNYNQNTYHSKFNPQANGTNTVYNRINSYVNQQTQIMTNYNQSNSEAYFESVAVNSGKVYASSKYNLSTVDSFSQVSYNPPASAAVSSQYPHANAEVACTSKVIKNPVAYNQSTYESSLPVNGFTELSYDWCKPADDSYSSIPEILIDFVEEKMGNCVPTNKSDVAQNVVGSTGTNEIHGEQKSYEPTSTHSSNSNLLTSMIENNSLGLPETAIDLDNDIKMTYNVQTSMNFQQSSLNLLESLPVDPLKGISEAVIRLDNKINEPYNVPASLNFEQSSSNSIERLPAKNEVETAQSELVERVDPGSPESIHSLVIAEDSLDCKGTPETILDTVSETEEDIYIDRVVTSTPNPYESVENMQASLDSFGASNDSCDVAKEWISETTVDVSQSSEDNLLPSIKLILKPVAQDAKKTDDDNQGLLHKNFEYFCKNCFKTESITNEYELCKKCWKAMRYRCRKCAKSYSYPHRAKEHLCNTPKKMSPPIDGYFQCEKCPFKARSLQGLKIHMGHLHGFTKSQRKLINPTKKFTTDTSVAVLPTNESTSSSLDSGVEKLIRILEANKRFSEKAEQQKKYACKYCDKVYHDPSSFINHVSGHDIIIENRDSSCS